MRSDLMADMLRIVGEMPPPPEYDCLLLDEPAYKAIYDEAVIAGTEIRGFGMFAGLPIYVYRTPQDRDDLLFQLRGRRPLVVVSRPDENGGDDAQG